MFTSFFRTIIFYLLVIVLLRVMGKRQIGELQATELAVTLLVADLASIPMQATDIPLLKGIIPLVTLLGLEVLISYGTLKSRKMRRVVTGVPTILIDHGTINQKELNKLQFNIDDLLEELRQKDVQNVADVEFAIFETNGKLSVFPKPDKVPITPGDLNMKTTDLGMPIIIISDGQIDYDNLNRANLSLQWLKSQLKKYNIDDFKKVFLFSVDNQKNIHFEIKDKEKSK